MTFYYRHHNRKIYPQKHILICEDDTIQQARILKHFSEVFDPQGIIQFSVVPGSIMARDIMSVVKVDLIILDHDMPQGNGSDLLDWLKETNNKTPVITFSGIPENNANMGSLGATYSSFGKEDVINGKADYLIHWLMDVSTNKGVAEQYTNTASPNKPLLPRYWVTPNLLIGGNICNQDDLDHLQSAFGIKAIINVDPRPDDCKAAHLLHCHVEDNGTGFPQEKIREIVQFAKNHLDHSIYIYCHLGFSRSPHFTYAILRTCYKMNKEDALFTVLNALPSPSHHWGFNQHTTNYMKSIEEALESWVVT